MQTFPFWGHTIEITDSMMRTGEIEREIEKARASTADVAANYKYMYNDHSDLNISMKAFENDLDKFRGPIIDLYTQKLNQDGFSISSQAFKEKYVAPNTRFPASYYALQKEVDLRVQREDERQRKADEDEVIAHNFGDSDAASGVKMGNAITGFFADMSSDSLLSLKLDYPNSRDVLVDAIVEGIACTHKAYMAAHNDLSGTNYYAWRQYKTPVDVDEIKDAATAGQDIDPEDIAPRFAELWQEYPFSHELYIDMLVALQDPQGEFETIGSVLLGSERFKHLKMAAAAQHLEKINVEDLETSDSEARRIEDICFARLRLNKEDARPITAIANLMYVSKTNQRYYTHSALSVFSVKNAVSDKDVAELSEVMENLGGRYEDATLCNCAMYTGDHYYKNVTKLLKNMRYLTGRVYHTVLGCYYDNRADAETARQRTRPAQELYHNTNFSDYGAVDMLYKTLHGQQQAGTLTAAEYNWLIQKAQRAAQLSFEVAQFLANPPTSENDFTYRYERIEHYYRFVVIERELRWLGLKHPALTEWLAKRFEVLTGPISYVKETDEEKMDDANYTYYRNLEYAYSYQMYLQRQSQQRGFFDKLKTGIQDMKAKDNAKYYETLTNNGQVPLPPMMEGERSYVVQLGKNSKSNIASLDEHYLRTYYPHLLEDSALYNGLAKDLDRNASTLWLETVLSDSAATLAEQYAV